jgi:broad specificity phosphatase PhoE
MLRSPEYHTGKMSHQDSDVKMVPDLTNNIATPPRKRETPKKLRRRKNGSPVIPIDPKMPTKTIYLIRHGHSQGQAAKQNGLDRKKDARLRDCGLTQKGESEAAHIGDLFAMEELDSIQLVLASPLTRALHTAILGFPKKNILVNFDLREVGSQVPENLPRAMTDVIRDLDGILSHRDTTLLFDATSLQPKDWPREYYPRVVKMNKIRRVFEWLYHERPETVIAVVCHYNVIRSAVVDGEKLRPMNATPIRCTLYSNGDLLLGNLER